MSCIVAIVDEKQKMMVISTDIAWNRMVPSPIGLGQEAKHHVMRTPTLTPTLSTREATEPS